MTDTTPSRLEPIRDAGNDETDAGSASPSSSPVQVAAPAAAAPAARAPASLADQLARLEDKTARIEEKLARSEGSTARVLDRFESASLRMSEVAQQSELAAVRSEVKFIARRIRTLPAFPALLISSALTAVLTAILTVLIIRYMPGLIGR